MNPGILTTRWRFTFTTSNGGASPPCALPSSSASWLVNVVLPVSRGPNSATLACPFRVRATWLANASIPTIFDGSSSGRSPDEGVESHRSLARVAGTYLYLPIGTTANRRPHDPTASVDGAARLLPMAARRFRPATRVALFLAAQGRCARCGSALEPGWHADHVDPVNSGGETTPANGAALCPRCNLVKGGRQR